VSAPLETLNSQGSKTALVIYHPGLTSIAHDIAYNFSLCLASSGWRVEIATANPQAPTNLFKYSLLVLSWPTYDFNPGPTITSQIHRIDNLKGIKTVIVAVGGGVNPFNAVGNLDKIVQNANRTIIQSITAFRSNHNLSIQHEASKIITP
jgi:flavorubredoxin